MIGKQIGTGKSYFSIVVDALQHGMPIIFDAAMVRQYDHEIKHAMYSSKDGNIYMGDMGWSFVYDMAQKLEEVEIIEIGFRLTQVKDVLAKGSKMENLNYQYENDFFDSLAGVLPKKKKK